MSVPRRIAARGRWILCIGLILLAAGLALAADVRRETSYVYPPFKHSLGMHRVGEMDLKLFLGPRARIANPQGIAAVKLDKRDDPDSKSDDDELTLFAVNSDLGQIIYNPSLTKVASYGSRGEGEGRFDRPRGIAADSRGSVAVADTGNRRLALLRLEGRKLRWRAEVRDAAGPFSPSDVALSGEVFWVTDYASGRILRFSIAGDFLGEWPLAGDSLLGPLALDVVTERDPWNRSRRFLLVVVDRQGRRVQAFDSKGRVQAVALADSMMPTPAQWGYPAIDLHGQVLLPDSLGGRLIKLDRKLRLLHSLERIDDDEKSLDHPNSLAVYRRFGQVFIAEAKGGSYAWTGTDILDPHITRLRGKKEGLQLEYRLTEPSMVSLIQHVDGKERSLIPERRRGAGTVREWIPLSRLDPKAEAMSLRAKPTYSARKKLTVGKRLKLSPSLVAPPVLGEGGSGGSPGVATEISPSETQTEAAADSAKTPERPKRRREGRWVR